MTDQGMAPPPASPGPPPASASAVDELLRDYHDARRREDQWRIPQLLLALATPLVTLIAVFFMLAGEKDYAVISGAVVIVTGTGAALLATQVWRWHRVAVGIGNRVRTEYPADAALLLKDPL